VRSGAGSLLLALLPLLLALHAPQRAAAGERPFDLQGHRGARGLAPENTLAAFARALSLGVTSLELDTVVTADGVVVVSHDALLNPELTRDAEGRWLEAPGPAIFGLTAEALRRYDVGRARPGSRTALAFPIRRRATAPASRRWPRCSRSRHSAATRRCASTSRPRSTPATRSAARAPRPSPRP